MRTTKPLLTLAIMLALPITANATGPAHDSGNSPVVATASAPYQTVTPDAHADEHIASTKYVIGAYNDAIAAVNKVNADKQGKLMNMESTPQPISNNVISSGVLGGAGSVLPTASPDEYAYIVAEMENDLGDLDETLPTTGLVMDLVRGAGTSLDAELDAKQDNLYYFNNDSTHYMSNHVIFSDETTGLGSDLPSMTNQNFINYVMNETGFDPNHEKTPDDILISAGAVFKLLRDMGVQLKSDTDSVGTQLSNKRVEIYTTWENDNAKTQVAFVNASAQ